MGSYTRPTELGQALDALAASPRTIVAGGTDYYPARVGKPLDDDVLDITALAELRAITDERSQIRIGAMVTWSDLIRATLPAWFDGLKQAAREVGGLQVQNAEELATQLIALFHTPRLRDQTGARAYRLLLVGPVC